MIARELPRGCRMPHIVALHSFEALRRGLDIPIGQQTDPHGDVPTEARVLHHHRAARCQVATTAVAEPTTLRERTYWPHRGELPPRLLDVATIRIRILGPFQGRSKTPTVCPQNGEIGIGVG